jgi:DNA-binding PadR family transcriptional regulator
VTGSRPGGPLRTLDYAVLGLVARAPGTGYEVTARLRNPVGYYWTESHGGVYPALGRLVDVGWVRVKALPGPGPHDKKLYSATAAGRRALGAWAAEPPSDPPPRDELVLKVSSIWASRPEEAAAMLHAEADRWEARRREYAAIAARLRGMEHAPGTPTWCALQTAHRGRDFARGRRDWCRAVAAGLPTIDPAASGASTS